MKKLLGAALCAALLFPGPASAELLKNLKMSGSLDVNALSANNITDFSTNRPGPNGFSGAGLTTNNDHVGTVITRTMLNLDWDLLDDVHADITLRKNDRAWGADGGVGEGSVNGAGNTKSQALIGTGGTGVMDNVYLQKANIKIDQVFGAMDMTVGRQYYGTPGDLVIYYGPKNTFGWITTSIDALKVDMANNSWVNVTGLAGQASGAAISAGSPAVGNTDTGNKTVNGLEFNVKNLPVNVNPFVYNQVTHSVLANGGTGSAGTNGLNDSLWVYGLRLKGEAMGGWAKLTGALNGGVNRTSAAPTCTNAGCTANSRNYDGKGLLLDLGYKADVQSVGAFTPWFNWGMGTGQDNLTDNKNNDFTMIASGYRPGVIYGRFGASAGLMQLGSAVPATGMAAITNMNGTTGLAPSGLPNRIIWGGGLKFTPAALNKFTTALSYWSFNFAHVTRGTNLNYTDPNNAYGGGNRHIGSEIDLQLDWKHSDNVMMDAGFATFQPGGFINNVISARQYTNPTALASAGLAGVQEGVSPVAVFFADLNVKF